MKCALCKEEINSGSFLYLDWKAQEFYQDEYEEGIDIEADFYYHLDCMLDVLINECER